ncbi:MAG: hypothetical protein HC902_11290, partial [Calothrix sp. SM1_5_4]|nr:hypothetical protein [Calothrix sp. SM1_5_4]
MSRPELSSLPRAFLIALIVIAPFLFMGALLGLFKSLDREQVASGKESTLFVICAFLAGLAYVGLHGLFLEKISFVSGRPTLSLLVTLDLFLVTSASACFLIESLEIRRQRLAMRTTLLLLVIGSAVGYIGLDLCSSLQLTGVGFIWLSSSFLFLPALCAGLAYGVFFKILSSRKPRLIPVVLCANGCGSLIAGNSHQGDGRRVRLLDRVPL